MRAAPPLATPSDVDDLTALTAAVLADTANAPPADLSRLVNGLPALGSTPRLAASTVHRFATGLGISGLGTSALRFPSPATGEVPPLGGGTTGRVLAHRAGGPPHISTAQLPAERTGEPPEYVQYEGRLAGAPSGNLDPPIYAPDSRRGTLGIVAGPHAEEDG